MSPNWSNVTFEGKHIDEKILHVARPSKVQTFYEISRIIIPGIIMIIILSILFSYNHISLSTFLGISFLIFLIFALTTWYKLYRVKRNYLYITSKRIMFFGIEGLFKDYVKKISLNNIRNVNYFTESFLGRISGYGSLEVQSSHDGMSNIMVYHIKNGRMITHYIDKLMSLSQDERDKFTEFDPNYFNK